MADGSPFLDGLFAGFSYLQVAGVAVPFSKTLNLGATFTATYNAATNAIDINVGGPSVQVPISDDGAGTISIGDGDPGGVSSAFVVPNADTSADAFRIDNATHEIHTPYPIFCEGVAISGSGKIFLPEIPIGSVGTPTLGFFLFVDDSDHKLKAKGPSGTVTPLANP